MSDPYEPVGERARLLGSDDDTCLVGLDHVEQGLDRLNLSYEVALVKGLARGGADLSQHHEGAGGGRPSPGRLFASRLEALRRRSRVPCPNSEPARLDPGRDLLPGVLGDGCEQQQVGERQIGEKAPRRHQTLEVEPLRDVDGGVAADQVGRREHRAGKRVERRVHRFVARL